MADKLDSRAFRITGQTHGIEVEGRQQRMLHELSVSVDQQGVRVDMTGLGSNISDTIANESRDVQRHWNDIRRLQQRTAYRNRPFVSIPKTRRVVKSPKSTPCPMCEKFAEPQFDCALCEGSGVVSRRQEAEYRSRHR